MPRHLRGTLSWVFICPLLVAELPVAWCLRLFPCYEQSCRQKQSASLVLRKVTVSMHLLLVWRENASFSEFMRKL